MYRRLIFILFLICTVLDCGKSRTGQSGIAPHPALDQKELAKLFDQMAHGEWTQGCQSKQNYSFESFFKFEALNSGNQKIVIYDDLNCAGEVIDYKVRSFTYQVVDLRSSAYDVAIRFDEPEEGQVSTLNAVFEGAGPKFSYTIRDFTLRKDGKDVRRSGSDLSIQLNQVQSTKEDK
jgi:hypothetical protein